MLRINEGGLDWGGSSLFVFVSEVREVFSSVEETMI